MLRKLLTIAALLPIAASAQTVATFEALTLPGTDTFYVNYTMPGKDVGFINGLAHFPTYYDTGFGSQFLSHGFTYSNVKDSVTTSYLHDQSAKPGGGYDSSSNYAVAYGLENHIQLLGGALGHSVQGFYVTNTTFTANVMRDGSFPSRKFGDTTGTHSGLPQGSYPDFLKLIIKGYRGGVLKSDSVQFYLADYTFNNNANDYIVKDWRWVNLMPLGAVDSLQFTFASSDTGAFGINTPLYFCMDNFTTNESGLGIGRPAQFAAKVYPMPARDVLNVEDATGSLTAVAVYDAQGRVVYTLANATSHVQIPLQNLSAGVYFLQLRAAGGGHSSVRFIKE